jgi:Thymidylate synthase
MTTFKNFDAAIKWTFDLMRLAAKQHHRPTWQGVDVTRRPDMMAYECLYVLLKIPFMGNELDPYRDQICPNLPWADDHFLERVDGLPLNPGSEWANWPWAKSADTFRHPPGSFGDKSGKAVFDHTYMQRYWPKFAGHETVQHKGIYFPYGDLDDVVKELYMDPGTRQAILPVWFPEDTGYRKGRRKPCSLFYHFQLTSDKQLDIVYSIRSCDLMRHFRDDIYLTVRLNIWMLEQLIEMNRDFWAGVTLGQFVMLIDNLHLFTNDRNTLWGVK